LANIARPFKFQSFGQICHECGVPVERRDVFLQRVAALLRRQAGRCRWPDRFATKSHQLRKRPKAAT
jgi:hypothetical protein